MRIVAYLCLSFCLLSFDIHASSAPLVIKQGIEKQEFKVAITNEAKPVVEFDIEEDGLLIIEVKQQSHALHQKLKINGKEQPNMDMFGYTEGKDFVSHQVKQGDIVELFVFNELAQKSSNNIYIYSYIIDHNHVQYPIYSTAFNYINQISQLSYKTYNQPGADFKEKLAQILNLHELIELQLKPLSLNELEMYLSFDKAITLVDLGDKQAAFTQINDLKKKSHNKALDILIYYYTSLLMPEYLTQQQLLSYVNSTIELTKDYNNYIYQNSRLDQCTIQQQQGKLHTALECFQKIFKQKLFAESSVELATLQANLAHLYQSTRKYYKAIAMGEKALKNIEKIRNDKSEQFIYLNKKAVFEYQQAIRLNELGLINDALPPLLSAIITFDELNQKEFLLDSLNELAAIYLESDQPALSLYITQYVLSRLDKNAKTDHHHLFKNALNIASQSAKLTNKQKLAENYLEQYNHITFSNDPTAIQPLLLQYQVFQSPESKTALLEKFQASSNLENFDPEFLLQIARLFIEAKQYQKLSQLLEKIQKSQLLFNQQITLFEFKAQLALYQNNIKLANSLVEQSISLIQKQYRQIENLGLKRNYYSKFSKIFQLKTRLLLRNFYLSDDRKYLAQASHLNMPLLPFYRTEQVDTSSKLERQQLTHQLTALSENKKSPLKFIKTLLTLEKQYQERLNIIANQKLVPKTRLLGSSVLTLHYVLMPEQSFLFVYKNNRISVHLLPDEQQINSKITTLFDAINNRSPHAFKLANELSITLIPQALIETSTTQQLTVIGSGLIWQLPFNILPIGDSTDWKDTLMIDKFLINKGFSNNTFNDLTMKSIKKVLSVTDPVFTVNDARVTAKIASQKSIKHLTRLYSGRKEASSLANLFNQQQLQQISGFNATKSNFIDQVNRLKPQLIHVSSHSYSSAQEHRNAGIFFSGVTAEGETQPHLLKLQEIEQLNNQAELVVLSACESNVGRSVFKSPIDGLAVAFISAGSKRVLASQWSVPSRATATLMSHMYKNFKTSNELRSSLHHAQQQTRKQYQHPLFWAGFTLTNNI